MELFIQTLFIQGRIKWPLLNVNLQGVIILIRVGKCFSSAINAVDGGAQTTDTKAKDALDAGVVFYNDNHM